MIKNFQMDRCAYKRAFVGYLLCYFPVIFTEQESKNTQETNTNLQIAVVLFTQEILSCSLRQTDGQTDRRTRANLNAPPLFEWEHKNYKT